MSVMKSWQTYNSDVYSSMIFSYKIYFYNLYHQITKSLNMIYASSWLLSCHYMFWSVFHKFSPAPTSCTFLFPSGFLFPIQQSLFHLFLSFFWYTSLWVSFLVLIHPKMKLQYPRVTQLIKYLLDILCQAIIWYFSHWFHNYFLSWSM